MELPAQLKAHRERIGLSQEETARRIFVSRQTVSNWETGKTYPDVQSLLLLSGLFGISIDELVKGDVGTMREVVSKDAVTMERLAWAAILILLSGITCFLILCAVWHEPVFTPWMPMGFIIGIPILVAAGVAACICEHRVEVIKKKHNLVAYAEISAFMEGEGVDAPIPVNERAFSRVHPKASALVKVLLGALCGLVASLLIGFVVHVLL